MRKEPKTAKAGGGLSGTELAIFLNKYLDRNCTLVEMAPELGNGDNRIHAMAIAKELKYSTIDVRLGNRCTRIDENGVYVIKDGQEDFIPADTVVVALGLKARSQEATELSLCVSDFYLIGDCNTPRNISHATDEAYHVAMDIGRL